MNQNAISRLESPDYGKPTLTTLKRLAAAMDIGLAVRFVPFSELMDWVSGSPHVLEGLTHAALAVSDFEREETEGVFDNRGLTLGAGASTLAGAGFFLRQQAPSKPAELLGMQYPSIPSPILFSSAAEAARLM